MRFAVVLPENWPEPRPYNAEVADIQPDGYVIYFREALNGVEPKLYARTQGARLCSTLKAYTDSIRRVQRLASEGVRYD